MQGFFITGTDTGVGKTYVSCLLAQQLKQQGVQVVPRKPIESGCIKNENGKLIPADATALRDASGYAESLEAVCKYRFEPAISPQRAAALAGLNISTQQLTDFCLSDTDPENDYLIVEGAGGFYSPLCTDGLNADLAEKLQLPVVLVVADRLGCINHTLLTIDAIRQRQLTLAHIILNQTDRQDDASTRHNHEDIARFTDCNVIKVSLNQTDIEQIKHYTQPLT